MGASAGRVLLISKGDWNSSTTYTGLDWVRHKGAAWVCKNTCTNIEPTLENTNYWQMMARDGDGVTADTAMSSTSTNAVQNKVIKSYVDNSITGISDMTGATATQNGTHGFVPAPQAGDEEKVLLGDGTWGAIDDKFSFSDHDTATSGTSFTNAEDGNMLVTDWTKNLLNPTVETCEVNGVTCTRNVDANGKPDGTYTLNGTCNENSTLNFVARDSSRNFIKKFIGKKLKFIYIINDVEQLGKSYMCIGQSLSENWVDWGAQINNGESKTISDKIFGIVCDLHIFAGDIFNNVLIKPMLTTDLSATYDDFVPYGGYEIQSCGKNLWSGYNIEHYFYGDGSIVNYDCISSDFIPTNGNTKIHIGYSYNWYIGYSTYDRNKKRLSIHEVNSNDIAEKGDYAFKSSDFSSDGSVEYIKVMFYKLEDTPYVSFIDGDFEPYTGETITVTNDTESPAFGLKSHKGITNIISPGNVKCVYPTNESGKGVLDAMYNNELSKLKNAIFTYSTKAGYDAAVANNEIPDGATVIKDYDD